MPAPCSWKNANNFTSPLRRFAAWGAMAFFLAVPGAQANHVAGHPNAATMASILNIITQLLLDDPLVIPAPADPKGTPILADFNGDDRTDLLVQPPNGTGTVYLFLADSNGKYTTVSQSWNAAFLSLAWGKDASTLYVGDYNSDGRADIIVESKSAGGRNALLYNNGNGLFDAIYQSLGQPPGQ